MLFSHTGITGPSVLKLSAWGARDLAEVNHLFDVNVNWCYPHTRADVARQLQEAKGLHGNKKVSSVPLFGIPKRLWARLCEPVLDTPSQRW